MVERAFTLSVGARAAPVAVSFPSAERLLAEVRARFEAGRGFALATVNLDHMVKLRARGGGGFRAAYAAHDLVVADGNPIVWLSRLARRPVALAPGADLIAPLARAAAEAGAPVALVGSTTEALAAAADALRRLAPGLEVTAEIAPRYGFDPEGREAEEIIAQLDAVGARLVFLALGAPKQEVFAARAAPALPHTGFASIGAGLDFLAGRQTRAPRWVRRLAIEWLWRAVRDPRRLAMRYIRCILILPALAADAVQQRREAKGP